MASRSYVTYITSGTFGHAEDTLVNIRACTQVCIVYSKLLFYSPVPLYTLLHCLNSLSLELLHLISLHRSACCK